MSGLTLMKHFDSGQKNKDLVYNDDYMCLFFF